MTLRTGKIYSAAILCLSVIFTAAHLIWFATFLTTHSIGFGSLLLIVIAYGMPLAIFTFAFRLTRRDSAVWKVADTMFLSVTAAIFIAMAVHTTIDGVVKGDFFNSYFNIPIIYAIPTAVIGIVWLLTHTRPTKSDTLCPKILYFLALSAIAVMIIHCGTLCLVNLADNGTTGAPWWVLPLAFGLGYLVLALLLYIAFYICKKVRRRADKT